MQAATPLLAIGGSALGGPAVGMGIAALGGAMSVMGGVSQASAYRTQAAQYQQQARLAAVAAQSDEANRLTQLNQAMSANHAMAASGNIDVMSPTMMALDNANRDLASRSIAYSNLSAQVSEQQDLAKAQSDQQAAGWSIMGGLMQGATSIYQGAARFSQIGSTSALPGSPVVTS